MFNKLFPQKPKKEQSVDDDDKISPEEELKTGIPTKPSSEPLLLYLEWRKSIFAVEPKTSKLNEDETVYGLVMDLGLVADKNQMSDKKLVVSVTAFASLEASLRNSSGSGIMGLGQDELV